MRRRQRVAESQVDMQLKQAKTQAEMARAKLYGSQGDINDQTFLDNETGFTRQKELDDSNTKHRQAMELENGKTHGKIAHERSKPVKPTKPTK